MIGYIIQYYGIGCHGMALEVAHQRPSLYIYYISHQPAWAKAKVIRRKGKTKSVCIRSHTLAASPHFTIY